MKQLLLLGFICFVTPSVAFAYLDPGSGSLLLSSVVALFASIIFFLKNIFYKISHFFVSPLSIISKGRGTQHLGKTLDKTHSIAFYCEGAQYYLTFCPILDALDKLNHPYTFLTSNKTCPSFNRHSPLAHFIYIGVGNKAYTYLNTLKADILVLTTPGLNVLHIKRTRGVRHYCHIVHSLTPMTYRAFGIDYFDSVLVANEVQKEYTKAVYKAHNIPPKYIQIVGSTYLDELDKIKQTLIKKHKDNKSNTKHLTSKDSVPNIVISPSWGKESLLSKYGLLLLEPLAKSGFNIVVRPHPQSFISPSEAQNIASLKQALSPYPNISWDKDSPNIYAFAKADLLIGDFSSSIFDFFCLFEKPVISLDFSFNRAGYDYADLDSPIWAIETLKESSVRISAKDFLDIKNIILKALSHKKPNNIKSTLWRFPNNAEILAAKEILRIERELLEHNLSGYARELLRIRELDSMLNNTLFKQTKNQKTDS